MLDTLNRSLDVAYRHVTQHDHADLLAVERTLLALDEIHVSLGQVLRSPTLYGASLHDALSDLERRLAAVMVNLTIDRDSSNDALHTASPGQERLHS